MWKILKMNNKNDVDQLLIIGNGFDLHCGLKTDFEDYFKSRFDGLNEIYSDNFWDCYFKSLKDNNAKLWSDVETQIQKCLEENILKLNMKCDVKQIQSMFFKNEESINIENLRVDEEKGTLGEYLLSELKIFENNFQIFLRTLCGTITVNNERKNIDISKDTLINQKEYMRKFSDELDIISENQKYNLLSFNYTFYGRILNQIKLDRKTATSLFQVDKSYLPHNCKHFFNIHGQVYDDSNLKMENVLIGVNSNKDELRKFSKEYRLKNKEKNWKKEIETLLKNVNTIKFYGHSLSFIDYPYFEYIFDKLDVNKNQNITFELGYSDFDNAGKDKHEMNEKERFRKLLNKYSNGLYEKLSFENKIKCFQL